MKYAGVSGTFLGLAVGAGLRENHFVSISDQSHAGGRNHA